MESARQFERLAKMAAAARAELTGFAEPSHVPAEELFVDEIFASATLSGAALLRAEVAALVERGVTGAERRLEDYVLVADYAEAARYVRHAAPAGRRRQYLALQEVIDLHALAVRRSTHDRPGTWRTTTIAAFASGMVAPPAWLVPQGIAALVERLSQGPPAGVAPLLWVAEGHERFERLHPFATANGRVGRLVANLLLRRLGYPPLILGAREGQRYFAALARADSGDLWPLGAVVARGVLASFNRLAAAAHSADGLRPLAALTNRQERPALYKAAQRGSLPALRRGGQLLTTQAWIDAYRRERPPSRALAGSAETHTKDIRHGDDSRNARPQ